MKTTITNDATSSRNSLAAFAFFLTLFGASAFAQAPVRLKQGWSAADSEWFYSTTQGSQLMPYAYYIALEQAGNTRPFNSPENMERFRCLPRPATPANPDALPVGFVMDKWKTERDKHKVDGRSIGFTCAACHTGQLTYQGTTMRIDGGPSFADMDALIVAIHDAMKATLNDPAKFARFKKKVLANSVDDYAIHHENFRGQFVKRTDEIVSGTPSAIEQWSRFSGSEV